MKSEVKIERLMEESGVRFGTSGARGLVTQMTDRVCSAYTLAFLLHLRATGNISPETPVVIGGDLRPSTPRILRAVAFAAEHLGHPVEFAGYVPSPAVALRGLSQRAPSIMVTGSHIPDDRNGIKFNTPEGEITKSDEEGVRGRIVSLPDVFDKKGSFRGEVSRLPEPTSVAREAYEKRYTEAFPPRCLEGFCVGVYGHSAVGRDILVELYAALGAEVVRLGWSDTFVPVDTEAVRPEDIELARGACREGRLDAVLSTDGDSDRPLTFDERGELIRGDVAGIITARYLRADAVATPVSCNTAIEKSGAFASVLRCRIGSPYVIERMEQARRDGAMRVVGYEANGGFLTMSDCEIPGGGRLPALPTRDAVIVHLALLLSAKSSGKRLSEVLLELPGRFTESGRDQAFGQERSAKLFHELGRRERTRLEETFALGGLRTIDKTDGMRFFFENGEIVHLRASGNAPELRCYSEASSPERAAALVEHGLGVARRLSP